MQARALSLSTLALLFFCLLPMSAEARSFTARFSQDLSGNIVVASNSLMTCSTSGTNGSECNGARNNTGLGATYDGALNNNHYDMVPVDIDGDPSTSNSSSANLTLPGGSEVVWAGLYWVASQPSGMTPEQGKAIKLKGPGESSYHSLTATSFDAAPAASFGYDCFAEVTDLVQAKGSGTWTAGGVAARVASGTQAGWSLVVVYQDNSEPTRNLVVFDGQEVVSGTDEISIPITGFRTPPTGTVDTTVGIVTFEGDRGIVGDYAQLDGNTLHDGKHLSSNFFNSWISRNGSSVTSRSPAYTNQLGFDSTLISVGDLLGNNATSTTLYSKTDGDAYQPVVFTFSTDLYAPHFNPTKQVEDLNGGEVRPDDILEYTIDLNNDGGDNATNMVFSESAMPSGTGYVADSVLVDGSTPDPTLVDQPADGGTGALTLRLGTGASESAGGTVAPGESHQIKFQVRVNSPLPAQGAQISNQALMNFVFESLGQPMQVKTNIANITVKRPDLAMAKTVTSDDFADGLPGQYTLHVSNVGLADTEGTVTVTDTLPTQFANPSISSAGGWACDIVSSVLTCTRSDALAPDSAYPDIVLDSPSLNIPTGETVSNTATVSTALDADSSNDSSTVSTSNKGTSTLAVHNTAGVATAHHGESVSFTADYTNTGPSVALNPTLTFTLTNSTTAEATLTSYTVTSSDGKVSKDDCAVSTPGGVPTITCTPASLAKDATVQIVATLLTDAGSYLPHLDTRAIIQADNDAASPKHHDASTALSPSADLILQKSVNPTVANRGQSVYYGLRVTSMGPSLSGPVTVVDPMPSGLVAKSAYWSHEDGNTGTCSISSNTVHCNSMELIRADQFILINIQATVATNATGYQDNTAVVSGTHYDPDPSNNSASARFTPTPSVNLTVDKTGPQQLAPQQSGTYTIQVTNHGPSVSQHTVVREQMPQGMTFVGKLPAGCQQAGHLIVCQAGSVAVNAKKTYRFRMKMSAALKPGMIVNNQALVSSSTSELVPSDNQDQIHTTIKPGLAPLLGIQLFVQPQHGAHPGEPVRLTVRIRNRRYATIYQPKACVTVPLNLWGNPYRHICWYSGPLAGYAHRDFSVVLPARKVGMGIVRAGTEAANAGWVGTTKPVWVQGGFTG